ncbi:AAR2 domain-containing protein [Phyllosticta paracitricarpa]|uniref:AAR2 protein-domain-containing protein n=1 Tax=Phyllosticta paracitricarpa TaxID=2016321 RepID=A0ABR1N1C7_9PEZI
METNKACVLLLNLPPGALGGINLLSFTTTDRFKGVKELPSGWHFVFTSSTSSLSVRHGAWFRVNNTPGSPPQVFIKKWDAAAEELVAETDEAETLRWRANLGTVWREGLTPYRQSASKDGEEQEERESDWRDLTDCISADMLFRTLGDDATPDHWALTSASSAARDMDDIPGLSKEQSAFQPERELRFLPVDLRQTWREGATGRERTDAARDRSWALGELVEQHCARKDEDEILGEMQFSFLMVLTLNNNSCLEQWRRLLELLFTCKRAVVERPGFYVKLLQLLRLQLKRTQDAEGGLFDLSEDGASLLKSLLRRFRKGLDELQGAQKADVLDELDDLEEFLKSEYGWQLDDAFVRQGMLELEDGEQVEMDVAGYDEDDETGEYAPTMVELTADQKKSLGLSEDVIINDTGQLKKLTKPDHGVGDVEQEEESEEEAGIEDMDSRY